MAQPSIYKTPVPHKTKDIFKPEKGRLLTVKQVSKILTCGTSHVYNLINFGKLKAIKIGMARGYRIYEKDVEAIMKEFEEADF